MRNLLDGSLERLNLMQFSVWHETGEDEEFEVPKSIQSIVRYKYIKAVKQEIYRKIQLMMFLKCVQGTVFIKLKLKQIELKKEIFLLDIEQGREVIIPSELSIDQFPLSYWYYDFILNYLQESISDEIKENIMFQTDFQFKFKKEENIVEKFYKFVGWTDPEVYLSNKNTVKHSIVNRNHLKTINHSVSHHTKSV